MIESRAPCVPGTVICNKEEILRAIKALDRVWSQNVNMNHLSWFLRMSLGRGPWDFN